MMSCVVVVVLLCCVVVLNLMEVFAESAVSAVTGLEIATHFHV